MNITPRSTCALDGNHNPSCTPLKAVVTIYQDPYKSSRSESSTQQKLKTCLFTLPPYRHCFNTHNGVRKIKASVAPVMCTRSLGGQRPGDSDCRQGRPGKGPHSVCSAWFWPLHHAPHPTNGWRQAWRGLGRQPRHQGSWGAARAHPPARLSSSSSWWLRGVVWRETPSRLRQLKWRACAVQSLSHVRLCDPVVCSLPGSPVCGISQERYCSRLPFPPPCKISQTERQIREWQPTPISFLGNPMDRGAW